MEFHGKAIRLASLDDGIVELGFDLEDEAVNKFNQLTLGELEEVTGLLAQADSVKGLLVSTLPNGLRSNLLRNGSCSYGRWLKPNMNPMSLKVTSRFCKPTALSISRWLR